MTGCVDWEGKNWEKKIAILYAYGDNQVMSMTEVWDNFIPACLRNTVLLHDKMLYLLFLPSSVS